MKALLEEGLSLRLSLLFTAAFLLYGGFQNWIKGKIYVHWEVMVLCLIAYALAFLLFVASTLPDGELKKFRHAPFLALIFITLFSIYVVSNIFYGGVYRTDALALSQYAAVKYLEGGVNPYKLDLQEALKVYPVDLDFLTFTESGDIITKLNYPALHFLILVPFVRAGLKDARWVIVLFEILTFAALYLKAPKPLKPLILIPIFAGADLAIDFVAGCVTDFFWVLPLTLAALYIEESPEAAAVAYGLASAVKQEPWFLAPFLLVWVWKSKRKLWRVCLFGALAAVAFLIPNLKFIMDGPKDWWTSIVAPLSENLVFISQGLSMVTQAGYIPLGKSFYLTATLTVYALLLVNYVVYHDKLKYAVWIFPAVTLWFSYRGLQSYFIHLVPVMAGSLLTKVGETIHERD